MVTSKVESTKFKIYVDVIAEFTKDGKLRPLWLIWEEAGNMKLTGLSPVSGQPAERPGALGSDIPLWCRGRSAISTMRKITTGS